jgi:hypothetical protein
MSIAFSMKELNDQNKNDDIHVEQSRSKCPSACTPLSNLTFVLFIFASDDYNCKLYHIQLVTRLICDRSLFLVYQLVYH